jgi:hypothetical protein
MSYQLRIRGNRMIDRTSRWLLSWERRMGTDEFWRVLWAISTIVVITFVVRQSIDLFGDFSWRELGVAALAMVLTLYSLLWGPAALKILRYREVRSLPADLLLIAVGPFYFVPEGATLIRRWGRGYFLYILGVLIFLIVCFGGLMGLFYLLDHAGSAGKGVSSTLNWLIILVIPIGLGGIAVSEFLARRRVRRALAHAAELSEERLVHWMTELADPVNVADYLRRLRVHHEQALMAISAPFLNRLMRGVEVAQEEYENQESGSLATRLMFVRSSYPVPLTSGRSLQLSLGTLQGWGGPALDELGRIFEQIRER